MKPSGGQGFPKVRTAAAIPAVALAMTSMTFALAPSARAADSHGTDVTCASASPGGWRAPVRSSYIITSTFGERVDPINHRRRLHAGVDLALRGGPGPVVAAAAGTVVRSGPYGGLGNEVTLQHADGVQTLYGHMSAIDPSIKPGAHVAEGQQLGTEGSTGHSTGPHVHFEVHVGGKAVDPLAFMTARHATLNGTPSASPNASTLAIPAAGTPRRDSVHQEALPIPADVMRLYRAAAMKYAVPWPILAGVGMEETAHGRNNHRSSAGALGLMQFLPSTFARYGVDGNGDGKAVITDDADSVYSAAHALRAFGVDSGPGGVKAALFRYNHAQWYVNDVLYYAAQYGGDTESCTVTAAPSKAADAATTWALQQVGSPFKFGADGPHVWDSSSFVQAAYHHAGVTLPRTAGAQRDWLAAGHGTRVAPGHEQPGDLIFEDSYLGAHRIGFVLLVTDASHQQGVAARDHVRGVASLNYAGDSSHKHIYQVWRVSASH